MLVVFPSLFQHITLILPSYRGLFVEERVADNKNKENFRISIQILVQDVICILKHNNVEKIHCLIGWSLGAQTAVHLCHEHPYICEKLFLLNPTIGTERIHIYTCTHTNIHIHIHTHTYMLCIYICRLIYTYAYMYECIYA